MRRCPTSTTFTTMCKLQPITDNKYAFSLTDQYSSQRSIHTILVYSILYSTLLPFVLVLVCLSTIKLCLFNELYCDKHVYNYNSSIAYTFRRRPMGGISWAYYAWFLAERSAIVMICRLFETRVHRDKRTGARITQFSLESSNMSQLLAW